MIQLEKKMNLAMQELKECVELSIELRRSNPQLKSTIDNNWTQFLSQLLEYIRRREKETGEDLLKGFSLAKLLKLW